MTLAELVPLALQISITTMIFAMGLGATPADLIYLVRRPRKLVRSLASMYGVMLVLSVGICKITTPDRAVEIVIVVLSLAAIPPLLPKKLIKAGGDASYGVGLVVVASLFSVVWTPLAVAMLQDVFHMPLTVSSRQIASIVFLNILTPLVSGALVRYFAPTLARRIEPALARIGGLLLLAVLLPIVYRMWQPMFAQIGGGTVASLVGFIVGGLVSGQLLGGPEPDDRTVLAMASSSRHPGISMALAHLNFPNDRAVIGVVVLYLLLSAILALPYVAWRKRVSTKPTPTAERH
jgi:BASS family bile acid:Na+ symporter